MLLTFSLAGDWGKENPSRMTGREGYCGAEPPSGSNGFRGLEGTSHVHRTDDALWMFWKNTGIWSTSLFRCHPFRVAPAQVTCSLQTRRSGGGLAVQCNLESRDLLALKSDVLCVQHISHMRFPPLLLGEQKLQSCSCMGLAITKFSRASLKKAYFQSLFACCSLNYMSSSETTAYGPAIRKIEKNWHIPPHRKPPPRFPFLCDTHLWSARPVTYSSSCDAP